MTKRELLTFVIEAKVDIGRELNEYPIQILADAIFNEMPTYVEAEEMRMSFQRIKEAAIMGEKNCEEMMNHKDD